MRSSDIAAAAALARGSDLQRDRWAQIAAIAEILAQSRLDYGRKRGRGFMRPTVSLDRIFQIIGNRNGGSFHHYGV